MSAGDDKQPMLFDLPPIEIGVAADALQHAGVGLPSTIRLGTMNWSYESWTNIIYGEGYNEKQLTSYGLTGYSKHPLLRMVEIDRTYYDPLPAAVLKPFFEQVPDDFRFLVKAHEDVVVRRYPMHARYGKKRGQESLRFLDASYTADCVLGPIAEGLGDKLAAILFQFPPQDVGGGDAFADMLHRFLTRLPKGLPYVVEIRNEELLTRRYGEALADAGALHSHNAWTSMPDILSQARLIPRAARRPLFVRWLMRQGDTFEDARARFLPFNRIVLEDPKNRNTVEHLVTQAHAYGVPAFVLVDNKAEGCGPESIIRLAHAIADRLNGNGPVRNSTEPLR